MKKIMYIAALAGFTAITSCATMAPVLTGPSSDETSVLAVDLNLRANALLGFGFNADLDTILAVKIDENNMKSETVFPANAIRGRTVYFLNLPPGKYALAGIVYSRTIKGTQGNNSYGYVPNIRTTYLSIISQKDMPQTVIDIQSKTVNYAGILSVDTGGDFVDDLQAHYQGVFLNTKDMKPAYPALSTVKKGCGSVIRGIINTALAKKEFTEKARIDLKGSGWEKMLDVQTHTETPQ